MSGPVFTRQAQREQVAADQRERSDLLRKLDAGTAKTLERAPLQVLRGAVAVARPPKPGRDTVIGTPRELDEPKVGRPDTRVRATSTSSPSSQASEMDRRMGIRRSGPAIVDNGTSLVLGTMRPAEARAAIESRAVAVRATTPKTPAQSVLARRMPVPSERAPRVRDEGSRQVFPTMRPADVLAAERERNSKKAG